MKKYIIGSVCLVVLTSALPLRAQETEQLSAERKQQVVNLVEQSIDGGSGARTTRGSRSRVLVGVWAYALPQQNSESRHLAEVTHYDYQGGVTLRTTVDLSQPAQPKILGTERLKAYPTRLAPEELAQAVRLAQQLPEVQNLFASSANIVRVTHLAPVMADRDSPSFGHRLVKLFLRAGDQSPGFTVVDVDLSQQTARLAHGN
jgi:hypothetical protein